MTQTEIGAIMGVTEGAVRKIVNGDTQTMQLDRAIKLARHLGVSVYYIACEAEPVAKPLVDAPPGMTLVRTAALDDVMGRIQDLENRMAALEPPHAGPPAPKVAAKSAAGHK